jgi:hypothetical protein
VWPSRIEHEIHTIEIGTEKTLRFADVESLVRFGVDPGCYRGFDYSATQAIAAAANFLEFDGLLVPSARADCLNLAVLVEHAANRSIVVTGSVPVDWESWRKNRLISP